MASFNEEGLRKKLLDLNMTQQSIQTMSLWLIHHKKHAHNIVNIWYKELVKAPETRKLSLMYLANDVIQNSKKKGPEYNKEFTHRLQKAFKHLGSIKLGEKPLQGVNRLLQVWEERGVFNAEYIKEFRRKFEQHKESHGKKRISEHSTKYKMKRSKRGSREAIEIPNEDEFPGAFETEVEQQQQQQQQQQQEQEPEVQEEAPKPEEQEQEPASASPSATPTMTPPPVEEAPPTPAPKVIPPPVEPKPAPQPEDLIQALQDLENAATADAEVRKKIASLPPSVSDLHGLNKLQDAVMGRNLEEKVDEALEILHVYNNRLSEEMEARKSVARLLHDYISHQKDLLSQTEETLEEHRSKFNKVQRVRQELKAHLQNLPDISKLPNLGGGLAPLPSAGDLFT